MAQFFNKTQGCLGPDGQPIADDLARRARPCWSSVLYLGDVGGPTLILDQARTADALRKLKQQGVVLRPQTAPFYCENPTTTKLKGRKSLASGKRPAKNGQGSLVPSLAILRHGHPKKKQLQVGYTICCRVYLSTI